MPETRRPIGALGRLALFTGFFGLILLLGSTALMLLDGASSLGAQSAMTAIAALTAGAVLMKRLEGRSPGALGIAWTAHTPREVAAGMVIGVGSIAICVAALAVPGWVRFIGEAGSVADWSSVVALAFGSFAVAAFAEEILFRGYPFQVLVRRFGATRAVALFSVLFGAAHLPNPNVGALAVLNIALAGAMLSVAYLRTRSIWFATAVHLGWNWGMASLLDLPVSGLEITDTPYYEPLVAGPDLLTGGAFGPEGGLIGTAGFGLALLGVLRWPGLEPAPELRALGPLPDEAPGPRASAGADSGMRSD